MSHLRSLFLLSAALAVTLVLNVSTTRADEASAGGGSIQGQLEDRDSGAPVVGATISLPKLSLAVLSGEDGSFEITGIASGTYEMTVVVMGVVVETRTVTVADGSTAQLELRVESFPNAGEQIIITGTRWAEKVLDAPLAITAVSDELIEQSGGTFHVAALRNVTGVTYTNAGLVDQRISVRGFNSHDNSRMVWLLDGRLVNDLFGFPPGILAPQNAMDIKTVEVITGPASAAYGANAHTGVVNTRTKTPWDDSSAAVSSRVGTQSMVNIAARVADTVGDNFGWKFTGEYFQGEDFAPDRNQQTHYGDTTIFEGDLLENYDASRLNGQLALYYKQGDWNLSGGVGASMSSGIITSTFTRVHARGANRNFQYLSLSHPDWFVQVSRSSTGGGDTYVLAGLHAAAQQLQDMGETITPELLDPIRDQLVGQIGGNQYWDSDIQHRREFGNLKAVLGGQLRFAKIDADILRDPENPDEVLSNRVLGAYLQLDYRMFDEKLRLFGAARVDAPQNFSTQFSPNVAAVYSLNDNHRVRLGYSRAFKSPTLAESFATTADIFLGNRYGYTVRDAEGNVLQTIDPLGPEQVDSIELGYKAQIKDWLYLDATLYNGWYEDFISPSIPVSNPMGETPTFAHHADGEMVAAGTPVAGTLFTNLNFGSAVVRGADIGVSIYPSDRMTITSSVSLIERTSVERDETVPQDLLLNIPGVSIKTSVTLRPVAHLKNSFFRFEGRYRNSYEFESGRWSARRFLPDGRIPARFAGDFSAGHEWPKYNLTLNAFLLNAFDTQIIDILGAVPVGRMGYVQLTYKFGL